MPWPYRFYNLRYNMRVRKALARPWAISFPELRSPWPAVGKRELWEHPFSNNNGNNRILHIQFLCAARSLHLWYLWRMPEMDAPRALVFRPLVKRNEALGTRLDRGLMFECVTFLNCRFNNMKLIVQASFYGWLLFSSKRSLKADRDRDR